jgi:hypothetical protein
MADLIPWVAVAVLALGSTALLIARDWRWSLALLAFQYLAAFALIAQFWPLAMAASKLVTGWMATAALGITRLNLARKEPAAASVWPEAAPFRLLGTAIILLVAFSAAPRVEKLIPGLGLPIAAGSIILMGAGLLRLGTTADILRVVVGLLTLLSGFETLYAAVESSILVAALLAVVNLGLALCGSYLLQNSVPPEAEDVLL